MNGLSTQNINEANISAILDTYVYLDEQNTDYNDKNLKEILKLMPDYVKGTADYKTVLSAVNKNPELANLQLVNQSGPYAEAGHGYSKDNITACTFKNPATGDVYVAYRGTGDGKWPDNAEGLYKESTVMQRDARKYFDEVVTDLGLDKEKSGRLIVTGHSKGGNEAQYVTLDSKYGNLIDNCYSFDGQGFSDAAIKKFKSEHGEKEYQELLKKMYSICGENDYVHDLGNVVISEKNTYFIETSGGGIGGAHDIKKMIDGDEINWPKDGSHGTQGPLGQYAKKLSEHINNMNEKDKAACSLAVMSLVEMFMPYNDKIGGNYLVGTGTVKFAELDDFAVLLEKGVPVMIVSFIETGVANIINESEPISYFTAAVFVGLVTFAAVQITKPLVILDAAIHTLNAIANGVKTLNTIFSNVVVSITNITIDLINKFKNWYDKNFNVGQKYASQNPYIVINTTTMRNYAGQLAAVSQRAKTLDRRMNSLYKELTISWKDFMNLGKLLKNEIVLDYAYRLDSCKNWLNTTAQSFENAEKSILNNA